VKFCFECGTKLISKNVKFCHECGAGLNLNQIQLEEKVSYPIDEIENYKYFRLLVNAVFYDIEQNFKLNHFQRFIDDLINEDNLHPALKDMYDKGTLFSFLESYVEKLKTGEIVWDTMMPVNIKNEKPIFSKNDVIDIAEIAIDSFLDPKESIKRALNLFRDK
jgi:hypothetical protein